jgi:hypothetical protein
MGRRPIGATAMTAAERQHRRRARLRGSCAVAQRIPDDEKTSAPLKVRRDRLRQKKTWRKSTVR